MVLAIARSMQTREVERLSPAPPQPLSPIGRLRHQTAHPGHPREVRSLGVEAPFRPGFFAYEEPPAGPGQVRLDLCCTGLSADTELTFLRNTNPYLTSSWDADAVTSRLGRRSPDGGGRGQDGGIRPSVPAERGRRWLVRARTGKGFIKCR